MIHRLNDWLDRRGAVLMGIALIVITAFVTYGAVTNSGTDSRQDQENAASYSAELHICEALSVLSNIVHSNTSNAVVENAGTRVGDQFQANLDQLNDVEFVDPSDGTLNCARLVAGSAARD